MSYTAFFTDIPKFEFYALISSKVEFNTCETTKKLCHLFENLVQKLDKSNGFDWRGEPLKDGGDIDVKNNIIGEKIKDDYGTEGEKILVQQYISNFLTSKW